MIRAYNKWEEEDFPLPKVRCGLGAGHLHHIFDVGMHATDIATVRDVAIVLLEYFFNGMRESSVVSFKDADTTLSNQIMTHCLSVLKGKQASRIDLVLYTTGDESSPLSGHPTSLDLWQKWNDMRTDL